MSFTRFAPLAIMPLLLSGSPLGAATKALGPEALKAQAEVIVIGQVQSYRTEDRNQADGSKNKDVYLTVKVESVIKGENMVKPGDTVQAVCWVLVRAPRDGRKSPKCDAC